MGYKHKNTNKDLKIWIENLHQLEASSLTILSKYCLYLNFSTFDTFSNLASNLDFNASNILCASFPESLLHRTAILYPFGFAFLQYTNCPTLTILNFPTH